MNVLVDTNILISACMYHNSVPYKAFAKALEIPNICIVCKQSLEEMADVVDRKFPNKTHMLEDFLDDNMPKIKIVPIPIVPYEEEILIRDPDDRAILRAAIYEKADILISGDKDFLEAEIQNPKIMTASEFLNLKGES